MKNKKKAPADGSMPLTDHLRELRNRVVVCVIVLIAAILGGLSFAPQAVNLLKSIGENAGYEFTYISVQEPMMQYLKMSIIIGIIVSLPIIVYEISAFIRPGLKQRENNLFLLAMLFGFIFFCVGVAFAYFIMLPFMLKFLGDIGSASGLVGSITLGNYISFLLTIFIIFGTVFELPVLCVLLTLMGMLRASWMKKARRIMIVLIFILAAIITPPDIVSQIMVAIPIIGLYELSILLCTIFGAKREKARAEAEAELNNM